MNAFTNTTVRTLGIVFSMLMLLALLFAVAPKAHANDYFGGDSYDYSYDDGSSYDYSYDDDSYYEYSYDDGSSYDYSYPTDTGYSDYWYTDGYKYTGGSTMGGSSYRPAPGYTYQTQYQYQQQRTTPSNTSTCTAVNSCNSYWDDHSIFNAPTTIVTNNPAPQTVVYSQPNYPVYTQPAPVYTPTYYPAQRPVAYNNTPYVTLAAVPYTGLELGPVGTALYWGFLVLWCLLAAYLIVVKKIQNKIAAWFTGDASQNISSQKVLGSPSRSAQPDHFAQKYSAPVAPKLAGIDPFILGQISRAK